VGRNSAAEQLQQNIMPNCFTALTYV